MAEPRFACQTPEFMLSPWEGRRQIACTDYNPLIRHVCPKDGISRQITSTHYNRLPVDIGQCCQLTVEIKAQKEIPEKIFIVKIETRLQEVELYIVRKPGRSEFHTL